MNFRCQLGVRACVCLCARLCVAGACIDPEGAQLVPCGANGLGCPLAAQLWAPSANNTALVTALTWGGGTPSPGTLLTHIQPVPGAVYVDQAYTGAAASQQVWKTTIAPSTPSSLTRIQAQDGTCICAPTLSTTGVWARWLADGGVAVLFLNVGPSAASVQCDAGCMAALGPAKTWKARDVWARADAGTISAGGYVSPSLPADGGSLLFRLTPA